jgi:hypothetical protein
MPSSKRSHSALVREKGSLFLYGVFPFAGETQMSVRTSGAGNTVRVPCQKFAADGARASLIASTAKSLRFGIRDNRMISGRVETDEDMGADSGTTRTPKTIEQTADRAVAGIGNGVFGIFPCVLPRLPLFRVYQNDVALARITDIKLRESHTAVDILQRLHR